MGFSRVLLVFACMGLIACNSPTATPTEAAASGVAESAPAEAAATGEGAAEGAEEGAAQAETGVVAQAVAPPECPMAVPGTTPSVTRVEGEIAVGIDFNTPGDVEELRRQVAVKVRVHQDTHKEPEEIVPLDERELEGLPEAAQQAARTRWNHRRLIGTATVTGEDLPQGMRVKLVPADPAEVDALQEAVQGVADRLIAFGPRCPEGGH